MKIRQRKKKKKLIIRQRQFGKHYPRELLAGCQEYSLRTVCNRKTTARKTLKPKLKQTKNQKPKQKTKKKERKKKMSIYRRLTDKQVIVYSHNGLFGNSKN